MILKFWGTRGSIPVPGNDTLKYGGNTPCVEVRSQKNDLLILDAGSGIRELGKELNNSNNSHLINILISHYHWDHIQGIPFFLPLYQKENKIRFWGETSEGQNIETILSNQMTSNYFPIKLNDLVADVKFNVLKTEEYFEINDFKISTFRANHSSPTIAFKIRESDKCIVYMTDNELKLNDNNDKNTLDTIKKLNDDLIEFCRGCDYLIHDSMYDESTMMQKKGWGHTCNKTLAMFGILSDVKNLVLFHYNPDYSDDKIDLLLDETSSILKEFSASTKCIAAKEGMVISI